MPDGVAIGFCKVLSGALLCIIPSGVSQAVGGTLIADGIKDMIEHANDPINRTPGKTFEDFLDERQKITPESVVPQ